MANEQNLKPFQPGNKASTGRPKGSISIATKLREIMSTKVMLEEDLPGAKKGSRKEVREALALKLAAMALKGDIKAIKEISERIDGKTHIIIEVEQTEKEKMQKAEILQKLTKIADNQGISVEALCVREGINLEKYRDGL